MEPSAALSAAAQIAVAIAGFAGVVAVFRSGSAVFLFPYATMIIRNLVRFAPGQLNSAGGTRLTSYSLFALLTAVCLLQLFNIATLAAFWPFFLAIVAMLLGAMYQFVRLVMTPQHSR